MDRKTLLQFIVISAVIIMGWELVSRTFGPGTPAPEDVPKEERLPDDETWLVDGVPSDTEPERVDPEEVVDGLEVENERIRTLWTNRGAALQRLELLDYRAPYVETTNGDEERPVLALLRAFREALYSDVLESVTFITITDDGRISRRSVSIADRIYDVERHRRNEIVFSTTVAGKLGVRKTVRFEPDTSHYDTVLEFSNRTETDLEFEYRLRAAAGIEREVLPTRYLSTAVAVQDGRRLSIDLARSGDLNGGLSNESLHIAWTGVVSQYFAAMLWPQDPGWVRKVESRPVRESAIEEGTGRWHRELQGMDETRRARLAENHPNAMTVLHSGATRIPAGGTTTVPYQFIAVPLLAERLNAYRPNLAASFRSGQTHWSLQLMSLGTLSLLGPLMVGILDVFYRLIPNYGVAIILLTLLIRLVLHPLTRSSQMSMHRMRKLQPHLQELMQKYGDDPQRMAREQWKLYSKYGAHPLKGCFPMLLQTPFLLALFQMLRTAVQLRQAVFVPGWVTDLSRADTVWEMPFSLPVLGNNLNILPFIMVGAWMLNQQLMPTPADPKAQQQQKIMKWMPVLFAVMFYNFASGLLLYITFSSGFGAFEHWLIRRKAEHMELVPVDEIKKQRPTRPGPTARTGRRDSPEKKSWLQRLMEAEENSRKNIRQIQSGKDRKKK